MERVVAPVDHRYPLAGELVRVTVAPGQRSFEPMTVTAGTSGAGDETTVTAAEVAVQVAFVVLTE
jgi:hypothetical protein